MHLPHHRQLFFRHVAQTSPSPLALEIERGEGMYLYGPDGRRWLDLIAGISVSVLGHSHPEVVAAVQQQAARYMHTLVYGELVMAPQVELAALLARHLPAPLDSVYFVNSGAEATEGAMKLAKRYTGRTEIVACRKAYHGSTQGAASLMSAQWYIRPFRPLLPGIRHIDFNDMGGLEAITTRTAAVILETVQAEAGVIPPDPSWLQALRARCAETGTLLVLDEIQAGYGRTGTLWAFEQCGIVPDVLLLAKGMGGGMPIGAFIASRDIMKCLTHDPVLGHITTFGGHPVNCAAALATLQVLLREPWIGQVKAKEARFRKNLVHPAIRAVRSAGLLMAVELDSFEQVQRVMRYGLDHGLLTDWFLFNDRCLRIAPPLIISEAEIDEACRVLLEGIAASVDTRQAT